jgi:hypothetical protein
MRSPLELVFVAAEAGRFGLEDLFTTTLSQKIFYAAREESRSIGRWQAGKSTDKKGLSPRPEFRRPTHPADCDPTPKPGLCPGTSFRHFRRRK